MGVLRSGCCDSGLAVRVSARREGTTCAGTSSRSRLRSQGSGVRDSSALVPARARWRRHCLRANFLARHLRSLRRGNDFDGPLSLRSRSRPASTSDGYCGLLWRNRACLASCVSRVWRHVFHLDSPPLCIPLALPLFHRVQGRLLRRCCRCRRRSVLRLSD